MSRTTSQGESRRKSGSNSSTERTEEPLDTVLKNIRSALPVQAKTENPGFFGTLIRALSNSLLLQPYYVGQTLIQLGYEPDLPSRRYSFIFREYLLYYPGIIGYSRAIIRSDGWRALYRGFWASVIHNLVSFGAESIVEPWVSSAVNKLPLSVVDSGDDVPDTEENVNTVRAIVVRGFRFFLVNACTKVLVKIAAYPFEVIAVRAVAQHITKQELFSSMWGSMKTIYRNEGLGGFYAGFVPAIISTVIQSAVMTIIWVSCETLTLYISSKIGKVILKVFLEIPLSLYLPRTYSYPYHLVSRTMMVNNCGFEINTPPFKSFSDCYSYLSAKNALYRGSAVLFPRFVARDYA